MVSRATRKAIQVEQRLNDLQNVGDLLDWYQSNIAQQELNSLRTIKNKSHRVESLLCPYLSEVGISDCSSQLLDKAWLRPLNNRFSPSTAAGRIPNLESCV